MECNFKSSIYPLFMSIDRPEAGGESRSSASCEAVARTSFCPIMVTSVTARATQHAPRREAPPQPR